LACSARDPGRTGLAGPAQVGCRRTPALQRSARRSWRVRERTVIDARSSPPASEGLLSSSERTRALTGDYVPIARSVHAGGRFRRVLVIAHRMPRTAAMCTALAAAGATIFEIDLQVGAAGL